MIQLSIKTNSQDVQRKLNALSLNIREKVIPAAINKVAAKAKTEMVRQITSEFNIKADEVRARLRISKASRQLQYWFATLDPFESARRQG